MQPFAVINIEKDEEMVSALVGGTVAGTGRYKFLAKRNSKGKFEWAHFVERDNGLKEKVYRGAVNNMSELKEVLQIMNNLLVKTFGAHAEMKEGIPEFKNLMGNKFDDTIN
jgi:hypothetical protein